MTKAPTELDAERALRAALSQMGSHVGCAKGPVSGANTKSWVVENTMSLSWRIGRAVVLSRCTNTVDTVAESIISEVGGSESASVLFKGKIVGVERITRAGHAYGEVIIESTETSEGQAKEKMIIPFKNENIYAKKTDANGKGKVCLIHNEKQTPCLSAVFFRSVVVDFQEGNQDADHNAISRSLPSYLILCASSTRRMAKPLARKSTATDCPSSSLVSQPLRNGPPLQEG